MHPSYVGPANCVGRPLAILGTTVDPQPHIGYAECLVLELRMATVSILQNLDVRFEDGYARTWEDDWDDRSLFVTGKLPVVFSKRR